jgi:hypothetical protein
MRQSRARMAGLRMRDPQELGHVQQESDDVVIDQGHGGGKSIGGERG